MPRSLYRRVPAWLLLLIFMSGAALVAYGLWTRPLVAADRALADGRADAALAGYASAEQRFGRFRPIRRIFEADYSRALYNQLALLYQKGDFDKLLEKAAAAPPSASPHFWAGSALLSRALAERRPEVRLIWLGRAEEELKQALQFAPDDWDTKFNYELAARLAAGLRMKPLKTPDVQMQILRPQPRVAAPPRRTG